MAYIDQGDIEDVFGVSNVAAWSQLDATQQDTADTDRIASAIAFAEEDVENRLRESRFAVPLSGTSGTIPRCVVEWCAIKAGVWLYRSRGMTTTQDDADKDRYAGMEEYANQQIDLVLSGKLKPALTRAVTGPTAPVVLDSCGEPKESSNQGVQEWQ